MPQYKKGTWDGYISLYQRRAGTFPGGLADRALVRLQELDVEVRVEDRSRPPLTEPQLVGGISNIDLRPYQVDACDLALVAKRGVIDSATGTGKTEILGEIIRRLACRSLIIVASRDLARQTIRRFRGTDSQPGRLHFPNADPEGLYGIVGDDLDSPGLITAALYQTLVRRLMPVCERCGHAGELDQQTCDVKERTKQGIRRCGGALDFTETEVMREWLASFDALFLDECVSGETPVLTPTGWVAIEDLVKSKYSGAVLSRNGDAWEWAQVIGRYAEPNVRECVEVNVAGVSIQTTPDHLFRLARVGRRQRNRWVRADQLHSRDVVDIVIACLTDHPVIALDDLLVGSLLGDGYITPSGGYQENHGARQQDYLLWKAAYLPRAKVKTNVVIGKIHGKEYRGARLYGGVGTEYRDARKRFYGAAGKKRFDELASELTAASLAVWIMDDGSLERRGRTWSVRITIGREHEAHIPLIRRILEDRFGLPSSVYDYPPKAIRIAFGIKATLKLLRLISPFIPRSLAYKFGADEMGLIHLRRQITSVKPAAPRPVFDLMIAKNHNYTTSGGVVHNCHRSAATTWFPVVTACPAYYRYGLSATPFKSDPITELKLVGATGEVFYSFPAAKAVEEGVLAKPFVTIVKSDFPVMLDEEEVRYMDAYRDDLVDHEKRNRLIADIAYGTSQGWSVPTLILVLWREQGRNIRRALRQLDLKVEFIDGTASTDQRLAAMDALVNGTNKCLISSGILDEGVDVPAIGALILAGGGKAPHKVLQRIGRGLRVAPGKDYLAVFDFWDNHSPKHLLGHSRRRLRAVQDAGFAHETLTPGQLMIRMNSGDVRS